MSWPPAQPRLPRRRLACGRSKCGSRKEHIMTETWRAPLQEGQRLDFETDWSSIDVVPVGPGQEPQLQMDGSDWARPDVDVVGSGDTVRVRVRQAGAGFPWLGGGARLTLFVPRNVRGRLRMTAHAGSIDGRNLSGQISAQASAGSVRLEIASLDPGEHLVRAELGSVRVSLASTADVRVLTSTSMGSVRTRWPEHPNAPATLRLATELGSI